MLLSEANDCDQYFPLLSEKEKYPPPGIFCKEDAIFASGWSVDMAHCGISGLLYVKK
jgi:hypothetical protein